jgi:hypothetical protein
MSRMTDVIYTESLTNAIMMDADRAMKTIPNLDSKFLFLPYKFCADGPGPDKALYEVFPRRKNIQKNTCSFLGRSNDKGKHC